MSTLHEAYERLFAAYGPQHWWPGETKFEILVGTVLVQNTAWRNVEKAIVNLRENGVLTPKKLHALPVEELSELIRPAGYYKVKAQRLRNLLKLVVEQYDGDLEAMFDGPQDVLREELLAVSGIGPETADAILLYVGEKPAFVVDTYAHRVLARHGWVEYEADYHSIQEQFVRELPAEPRLYNEYHALLVKVGKEHCKTAPQCDGCPLHEMLPEGGPVQREW